MTTLALDAYTHEIDGMLGRASYDEAIAHCLHVLQHFPRHLATYRQLGKALFESDQHGDAADIFQRILSADPNDFFAHLGLATIREEASLLDQALWHMERAYELAPSNAAVQGELRRLYGRRDGFEPTRIRLSRGALARQYLRGDLFGLAIAELKSLLGTESDRMDLQVVLAEALWRDQQGQHAVERCELILEQLPNCVRANAILAELRMTNGEDQEAAPFLRRWQDLAPYEAQALQLAVSGGWAPPQQAQPKPLELPRIEWTSPTRADGELEAPDVGRAIGLALGDQARKAAVNEPETAAPPPEWRRNPTSAAEPPGRGPELPDFGEDTGGPDWLHAAEAEPAGGPTGVDQGTLALDADTPDWLREGYAAPEGEVIETDVLDGLHAAQPPSQPTASGIRDEQGPMLWVDGVVDPSGAPLDESPSVSQNLNAPSTAEPVSRSDEGDATAWLEPLTAQQGVPLEELPSIRDASPGDDQLFAAGPGDEGDALAWLERHAVEQGDQAAELPSLAQPAAEPVDPGALDDDEDPMVWLERLAAQHRAALEELPSLNRQLPAGREFELRSQDDTPEWLGSALDEIQPFDSGQPSAAQEVTGLTDDKEVRDWTERPAERQDAPLDEPPSVATPPPGVDDLVPDWLKDVEGGSRAADEERPAPFGPDTPSGLVTEQATPAPPADQPAADDVQRQHIPEANYGAAGAGLAEGEAVLAWLEQLTKRHGVPAEELPSLGAGEASFEASLPAWLRAELDDTAHGGLEEPEELSLEREAAADEWSPYATEELAIDEPEPLEEPPGTPSEPVREWLPEVAEEPPPALELSVPLAEALEGLRAQLDQTPHDHAVRLRLARLLAQHDDLPEALSHYEALIKASAQLPESIADLTGALAGDPTNARLRQVLGDAYSQDGQFAKALELFRSTLKELKK